MSRVIFRMLARNLLIPGQHLHPLLRQHNNIARSVSIKASTSWSKNIYTEGSETKNRTLSALTLVRGARLNARPVYQRLPFSTIITPTKESETQILIIWNARDNKNKNQQQNTSMIIIDRQGRDHGRKCRHEDIANERNASRFANEIKFMHTSLPRSAIHSSPSNQHSAMEPRSSMIHCTALLTRLGVQACTVF